MHRWYPLALTALLPLVGCANYAVEAEKAAALKAAAAAEKAAAAAKNEKSEEEEINESLAKLSSADRKLAEQQKYCAAEPENLLGSMGTPVKVMVKENPVFLCCKGCKADALKDPDKTLAKVDELKKKTATEAPK